MNQVNLIGRLGDNPQVAKNSLKFSIATNSRVKNAEGKWSDRTDWHQCFAPGKAKLADHLKKGALIRVTGRIQYSKYEDKYFTTILVFELQFLEPKSGDGQSYLAITNTVDDDDLPF